MAKHEMLQHLETDISARQCIKHPVSDNVARSSLCHKHAAPASPPLTSPVPVSAQAKGTKSCYLVVLQRRGFAEKCSALARNSGKHFSRRDICRSSITCLPGKNTQCKQEEISWSAQSRGKKPHTEHDLCCLFQDVPWRGAPRPRVTASPAPAGHTSP